MKPFRLLLPILAAVFALQAAASAANPALLNPTADTFVIASAPNSNYGGAGAMMISGAGASKGEMQALLKFNLATTRTEFNNTFGIGNWTIDSVTLQLGTNEGTQGAAPMNSTFNNINGGLFGLDWLANDSWVEGTGTPNTPSATGVNYSSLATLQSSADRRVSPVGGFTYTPIGNNQPLASYALSLDPSFVADLIAGGDVSLRGYAADSTVAYLFNSRSFATNKPVLVVSASAVPEPTSTAAFLAGGAMLGLLRRKRHAQSA